MFLEVNSCCCLFTPKQGSYILGVMTFLGTCMSALDEDFKPMQFFANLSIVIAFMIMVIWDSAPTRKGYFLAYFAGTFPLLISAMHSFHKGMFESDTLRKSCEAMKKENYEELGVTTQDECQQKIGVILNTGMVALIMCWLVFVEYWWFCALYTHYKNHSKENNPRHRLQEERV